MNFTKSEIKNYDVRRLFLIQKLELDSLCHMINRSDLYDINDLNISINNIIAINMAITKKLKNEKR